MSPAARRRRTAYGIETVPTESASYPKDMADLNAITGDLYKIKVITEDEIAAAVEVVT